MITLDLSKQQVLNGDPQAIQQINFTGNLDQEATMFFIIKEATETKLIVNLFCFNIISI